MTSHRVAAGLVVVFAGLSLAQVTPVIGQGGIVRGADNYDASFNGVARGSLFGIYGMNLAPSVAGAAALPLPTLLNGVRVKVSTTTGTAQEWDARLLYVSPSQINAILPSAVTEGGQSVVVEVNGVDSAAAPMLVATEQFAAFTSGYFGFGPAVLQQVDSSGSFSFNSFRNPAAPGQAMVLWGRGLGPLPAGASDADAPGVVDLSAGVTVYVGDVAVKPFYAGRVPANPGIDQINFYLPQTVASRCYVPLTVVAGTVASGALTLSAGTPGTDCTSEIGLSPAQVESLDKGGTVRAAVLDYGTQAAYHLEYIQAAGAWIYDYNAADLSLLVTGWQTPQVQPAGHCERSMTRYGPSMDGEPPNPDIDVVAPATADIGEPLTGWTAWFTLTGSGCSPASDPQCFPTSYTIDSLVDGTEVPAITGPLPLRYSPPRKMLARSPRSLMAVSPSCGIFPTARNRTGSQYTSARSLRRRSFSPECTRPAPAQPSRSPFRRGRPAISSPLTTIHLACPPEREGFP